MSKRIHYEPRMTGEKECKDCKRILPVIAFAVNHLKKDGLRSICRECHSVQSKQKYRQTHQIGKKRTNEASFFSRCGLPEIEDP